jgi:hypothetical protein
MGLEGLCVYLNLMLLRVDHASSIMPTTMTCPPECTRCLSASNCPPLNPGVFQDCIFAGN